MVKQAKAKAGHTLNAMTGACARLCPWKGACDWTGNNFIASN
jgi:hypothetical protein